MNGIIIRDGEPIEKAMRRFVKTCEKSGVLSELKRHRHFEKPSETKKRAKNSLKQRQLQEKRKAPDTYESRRGNKRAR